jgi:predicted nucleotidyltransferase
MKNKYIEKLKDLVLGIFRGEDVGIVLFGSRARNENSLRSDVDIGLIPRGKFDRKKITILKEKVEDMNIPYKVDIVNFAEVSADFRVEALKGAIAWKN